MPKKTSPSWSDATLAIHSGEPKHKRNTSVTAPIVRSANFTFADTAEMKRWAEGKSQAYLYTRYGNPTLAVAEEKIARLENGEAALVTASGSAAISSALLSVLQAGDELIATRQLYGGSYRLMRDILPRMGIRVHYVDANLDGLDQLVNSKTRAFYVETPTNPTLGLVDLKKSVALARKHRLVSIIDNTFATPILQKPLNLGFELVVHSATKYLAGHSDIIAGAVAGSRERVGKVREMMISLGGSMDPDPAYLLIRGLKTLEIRVRRQCESAMAVARFLERHPKIQRVHYPGLPSHPSHSLAKQQMTDFGGMLAFDIKGGLQAARRFCDRSQIFLLAASLGGVESLIVLPIYTSHFKLNQKELTAAGVSPGTVRMSIGLEDASDLLADLKQALS
ncbi:MAG TPA: aminotransferase class I/II-fold pyridoxal phosphate-dependent enzyme [Candidatus Saccharimonadales bacterium]|jgi:methionine-gamma-lyase|nr:aminotransferase class I/II-fold pyridoxal phosphate-dependent enzyme [Candidatus Saccharimonadales bacterium]